MNQFRSFGAIKAQGVQHSINPRGFPRMRNRILIVDSDQLLIFGNQTDLDDRAKLLIEQKVMGDTGLF